MNAAPFEASAKAELAKAMLPAPDDFLGDVGPLAQLYYLDQVAWTVLRGMTGMLSSEVSADLDDDDPPVQALAALSDAVGRLDGICQIMGLLPAEAVASEGMVGE